MAERAVKGVAAASQQRAGTETPAVEGTVAFYVNGQAMTAPPITLTEWLTAQGYTPAYVAVEADGVILDEAMYDNVRLSEGMHLEVVCFVGGG